MKKIFKSFFATVVAFATAACSSDKPELPDNPVIPDDIEAASTDVMYQANPRFFGENNCFEGITAQLDRISGMGCDLLWIMPIYEPGELKGTGSPYCIRDFKAVNPRYGTMDDFKKLVDTAHNKGMKVILDWIANHTAWDCPWITEHPDWYQKNANGEISSPVLGWNDVAQLKVSDPAVQAAMKDAMMFWVERFSIDGFRCDYADGLPHEFWDSVIKDMRAKNPDFIMLAEGGNPTYYADGFNMIYDWDCASSISKAFTGGLPANIIKEAHDSFEKVPEGKSMLRFVFNHDTASENNVATLFGSPEGVRGAYVLVSMLCGKGTPMIYSSMDVEGLTGKLSFFDYRTLDFSTTISDEYKAINNAFIESAKVRGGSLADYSNRSVACFTRTIAGHALLVAVNTTGEDQSIKSPITLNGTSMKNMITGTSTTVPIMIELKPYAYTILMN
ncbi:MAG: alpha-amylase [Muribaculaceae bacterium]|nr:alpha-amylase [Muribaculaceae bacterium]